MTRVPKVCRLAFAIAALLALPILLPDSSDQRTAPVLSAQGRQMSRVPRPLPSNRQRNWGETYYGLEGRARRVVAQFDDAIATSDRAASGEITLDVVDHAGRRLARGSASRRGGRNGSIALEGQFGRASDELPSDIHATLDWTTIQSHLTARESSSLVNRRGQWRDGYLRKSTAADNPDDSPVRLSTEFGDGIVATTVRRGASLTQAISKGTPYFSTVLTRGDEGIGTIQWHPGRQEMVWHFPGLTTGKMSAEILEQSQPGWSFTPTMAWANVQAFAFYEMHTKKKAEGTLAGGADCSRPGGAVQARAAGWFNFFSPTLQADEGCDFLHWLDGSIYRPCCDEHDRCYAKNGCSAWSWFVPEFMSSWECQQCNGDVWFCFFSGWACDGGPQCMCEMNGGWWDTWNNLCANEPIVISLTPRNDKIRLSAPEDGAFFDATGRGTKQKMSWILPRSSIGFLVLDRNGNGSIDDGTEWFGNNTPMSDGSKAAHGFVALRDLDGGDESDGAVTPDDPWYWRLRVWVDANRNGLSERSELIPLNSAGITALSTKFETSDWIDANGNVYPYAAAVTYRRPNGRPTKGTMYDAVLQVAE